MRPLVLGILAGAVLPGLALAQGVPRPAASRPAAAASPAPPAPPPIFPCRTVQETCFLGIVTNGQVAVIYTNATNGEGIDAKPVDVVGQDGSKADLSKDAGRAIMLAGTYDPKAGIKGDVVEVAGPLLSMSIKAQLGGGAPDQAPGSPKSPPKPRR